MPRSPSSRGSGVGNKPSTKVVGTPSEPTDNPAGTGAQHNPVYRDTSAEYMAVRHSDLREIARFGWLEEGVGAAGMFFVSGAAWMAATVFFDHLDSPGKYWPGYLFCLARVLFGVVLLWIAHSHFTISTRCSGYGKSCASTG
jgi:hypothetical protein